MADPAVKMTRHGYPLATELFEVRGDDLHVGELSVREIVSQMGSPAYIYDGAVMRRAYRRLAAVLDGFAAIYYSAKANPARSVIRLFIEEGAGVEIASIGEYHAAIAAGAKPERILFAGPGKRHAELAAVIDGGIGEIHIEGHDEIARLRAIGRPVRASLRINPVPAVQVGAMRMGGKATAFGFDEEDLDAAIAAVLAVPNIELVGIHVYGGTQILDAAALIESWRHAITLAARVARTSGRPLATIDLGGGLGIPYYDGDRPLDLDAVAAAIPDLMALIRSEPLLAGARAIVEPGRFLVGTAGLYVSEINAVKTSRGVRFLVLEGGMNHHLAASGNLGQVIKRNYPVVAPAHMAAGPDLPATVVGPLCTPLDTLARDTGLPALAAGDLVAVLQSGAYGLTASPGHFLSHPAPAEALVENGRIERIAR
ncbi:MULTISPECIES: type III PLP-dependent enzyme [unclassified Shinella]|uniref:type III PLP-dependent enzyme n=1 Tax=unclassified Shinella TaxID=2643062 RepID=UPI00234FA1EE|nr:MULTISPECIES: type III PLP-dependent enzyme [unclassified Shinella]MCO5151077.1 type III PLP-dependent enzyme [Shinella sp.]MDC7265926.1 type III PLP-dependent enzyme [Shinella sp. HY16]MDC7272823.1 type III PLP-dependent enzyme [Shinella sp. YZ44]